MIGGGKKKIKENMYSKITRTVVEEHYEDIEEKLRADNPSRVSPLYFNMSPANTDKAIALRLKLRAYFTKLSHLLREVLVSKETVAATGDTNISSAAMSSYSSHLAQLILSLMPYFSQEQANTYATTYITMMNSLTRIMDDVVAGRDVSASRDQFNSDVVRYSENFQGVLPGVWNAGMTADLLKPLGDLIIGQYSDRRSQRWGNDIELSNQVYDILSNGTPGGMASLADIISLGIVQAQPWNFTI